MTMAIACLARGNVTVAVTVVMELTRTIAVINAMRI